VNYAEIKTVNGGVIAVEGSLTGCSSTDLDG
jgi:hypothetical protein